MANYNFYPDMKYVQVNKHDIRYYLNFNIDILDDVDTPTFLCLYLNNFSVHMQSNIHFHRTQDFVVHGRFWNHVMWHTRDVHYAKNDDVFSFFILDD